MKRPRYRNNQAFPLSISGNNQSSNPKLKPALRLVTKLVCSILVGKFSKIVRLLALVCFLIVPALVQASNHGKLASAQVALQSILDTAPDQIRKGNFITGLSFATLDVLVNGLTHDNENYLRRILDLFVSQRILFVQKYEMKFPSKIQSAEFKLFSPMSTDGQIVNWQGFSSNKALKINKNKITVFLNGDSSCVIKICSLVETNFVNQPDVFYSSLGKGSNRNSFTSEISKNISVVKDLYDFVNFFGTYAFNGKLLPIQNILMNPFNIDCSEFSTIVLEILHDKNIPARYALGVSFPLSERPKITEHCWVRASLHGKEVDIDPTYGRKIGQIAYGCKLPFVLYLGSVESLNDIYSFPISVVRLNQQTEKLSVRRISSYSVYRFSGGDKNGKKRSKERF